MNSKKSYFAIDTEHLNKLLLGKDNLLLKSYEYSGKIIFTETPTCDSNTCYKYQKAIKTIKGGKASARIPKACVNFHTHPVSCYKDGKVIWGWPSGEDLRVVLDQRCNNMCHLVFALEGTYIMNSNKNIVYGLTDKEIIYIEEMFKDTHDYRSIRNYDTAHIRFKNKFPDLKRLNTTNTLELWLYLVNNTTITKNNKKYNVLSVRFIPNKTFHFNSTPMECYKKINQLNSKNIGNYIKFAEDIIVL